MIKLVACDLDGTLFNSSLDISSENIKAIRDAQKNGIEFIIATGRAPEQSRQEIRKYGIQTGFININGALVYDAHDQLRVKHPLSQKKALQIATILERHHLYYELVTADKIYSEDISQRIVNFARSMIALNKKLSFKQAVAIAAGSNVMLSMTFVPHLRNLLLQQNLEVMKIISFDGRGPKAFINAEKEIQDLGGLAITSSGSANIEINDIQAQKGPALLDYGKTKNIQAEEIAAIGDNLNDASMIKAAGTGVAMANAVSEIKKMAQIITKTNDENGVAHILRKFISDNAKE
ncbi:Cof-type HAD-IIB family hydrolase [Lactobacillus sp. ESL0228]|uniref:Cof-type HAD-IIB family hydrolase n=1 Tax=Lactobacillus sp. ESL0228 TaxID=2069352 RepID=UPI000EFB0A44|nr:Cof-type HAD-IIB family hydrolase [Lactobacillus sp. ESL0228]RMC49110.1 HAD family phosphatase [Lactobacillus sp. ESL0228]